MSCHWEQQTQGTNDGRGGDTNQGVEPYAGGCCGFVCVVQQALPGMVDKYSGMPLHKSLHGKGMKDVTNARSYGRRC